MVTLCLGSVALSIITKLRRDGARDALASKYKNLASKKHPVADGKLLGAQGDSEFDKIVKDSETQVILTVA